MQARFMIGMYIENDVNDGNYLYQMSFDNTCMLRIGCKPIYANQLNLSKT
jgi:hypothetical protein